MSKIAFIYPGQGAQKAGMGADFYEKSETARASLFKLYRRIFYRRQPSGDYNLSRTVIISNRAGKLSGPLDAEHGIHDSGGRGHIRRDWSGKDPCRVPEEDKS